MRGALPAAAALVLLATSTAGAQTEPKATPSPWSKGTTATQRTAAKKIFEKGNALFERSQFGLALNEYNRAIKQWDHPSIRYNMAVCLINLDRDSEALDNIKRALAWGAAPFEKTVFIDAKTHRRQLLRKLLTTLEVKSSANGARVSIDGKLAFVAPGAITTRVLPGKHVIEATQPGFDRFREELDLRPGSAAVLSVRMTPGKLVYKRRYKRWVPWVGIGTGASLALLSVFLERWAQVSYDRYDRGIEQCGGCEASFDDIDRHRFRGKVKHGFAVASMVFAGAAMAGGLTLSYMNTPRARRVERSAPSKRAIVTPMVGPKRAGVIARWLF